MNINLFVSWMKSFKKSIVDFDKDSWLNTKIKSHKSTQPGCYLTMRCGYSGIYTILDGSQIIAYKPESI